MPHIEILNEMIKPNAKLALENCNGKNQAILTEPQCTKTSVTIYGMPDNAIVIKADIFKSPDAVFSGSKGECKRADFVIVADTGKKKVILCIEMKSRVKTSSESEIIQQLKGAFSFIAYCQKIGKEFWNMPDFLDGYSYRFVTIRNISVSKKPTQLRPSTGKGKHDRPDQMLKISAPHHLQFNQLAGGG